jgi:molecular chaperone GrpE
MTADTTTDIHTDVPTPETPTDVDTVMADILEEAVPTLDGSIPTDTTDELQKLKDTLARAQADYANLVMRNERDKSEMIGYISRKIFTPLLTQIDHLERAVALKSTIEGDTFVDGIRTILSSLQKYLETQGVVPMVSVGEQVDPTRHDVMTQTPGADGVIVSEFEK